MQLLSFIVKYHYCDFQWNIHIPTAAEFRFMSELDSCNDQWNILFVLCAITQFQVHIIFQQHSVLYPFCNICNYSISSPYYILATLSEISFWYILQLIRFMSILYLCKTQWHIIFKKFAITQSYVNIKFLQNSVKYPLWTICNYSVFRSLYSGKTQWNIFSELFTITQIYGEIQFLQFSV